MIPFVSRSEQYGRTTSFDGILPTVGPRSMHNSCVQQGARGRARIGAENTTLSFLENLHWLGRFNLTDPPARVTVDPSVPTGTSEKGRPMTDGYSG